MGNELRRFPRWRHLAFVLYSSPTIRGEGQLVNVSQEGAFVRADALPLVGERVQVRLRDTPGELEFEGEVCWTGARTEGGEVGFGLQLLSRSDAYAELVRSVAVQQEPEPSQPPTSRPAPRVAVAIPVAIEAGTLCDEGQMRNISLSGARIESTQISLTVGAAVTITFSLSAKGRAFQVPSCVVRRTESGGYAVRFDAVDEALQLAIEGLVASAGDEGDGEPETDATGASLAALAAAQSWKVLSQLAESAKNAVVSVDEQQRILRINSAAERLFGVDGSAVLGRKLGELGAARGQVLPVDASIACVEAKGEKLFTLVMRDATERLRSEQALRESETRFRVMAETIPDFLFTARADGWTDYANARFFEYTGLDLASTVGYGWTAALHPEDVEHCLSAWRRSFESGEPYEIKYRFRSRDGAYRWFVGRARRIRDESGQIVKWFGVCSDIHELVLAQESLREADRRKNQVFALISRELRSPLAPIRNGLDLLRILAPEDLELESTRDLLDRQVTHLVRLVDDLLDVSRLTSGKIELRRRRTDLVALIEQALENTRPVLDERGHELRIELAGEPLWLEADEPRMLQALENVLLNAIKFTPPAGTIAISAQRCGAKALIRVRDSGVGIAPDALERIFELFAQEQEGVRSQGGLGIGLTLVRSLIELHGGRIRARSEGIGCGSEFEIELPLLEPRSLSVASETSAQPSRTRLRILLVEDNPDAAHSWKRLLQLLGHDVQVTYEGVSALQLVEATRPELAFIDIGLPGMDGYELAQRIRALGVAPPPRLIALTGFALEEDRQRALDAGFDAHLIKPVQLDALRALLAHVRPAQSQAEPSERVLH